MRMCANWHELTPSESLFLLISLTVMTSRLSCIGSLDYKPTVVSRRLSAQQVQVVRVALYDSSRNSHTYTT